MILQALHQYYERLAPERKMPEFGFSMENVGFVLEIAEDGKLVQEHDIRQGEGASLRPVLLKIPYTNKVNVRAVNIEPNFLVDKAAYLLGADQKTKASRLPECYKSFISLVQTVLGGIDDEGAKAVLKFYQSWKPTKAPEKLRYWGDITSDKAGFIAFQLCGERQYIHLRPKVRNAWQKYLSTQKSKLQGQCLLSGCQHTDLQQLHAQFKGIAGGQSSGKSLVSFNIKSAESYRKEQSFNAPVSIEAEFKSSTALKYLIRNDAQHLYIGETYTVFWTERDSPLEGMLGMVLDPNEAELADNADLRRFLDGVRQGKRPEGIDSEVKFYILGLSPNAARLAVRFWHVCSVGELQDRIGQHFRDLQLQRSFDSEPEYPGIRRVLWETYNKKSKTETASPLLSGTLMRCILGGFTYPQALQNAVINRIRADQAINYVRAAILKAILVRKYRINNQGMEVKMSLDKENKNPAYLLGRLFAVLEKAQIDALGKGINATIKDRFFGAASATPKVVFPQLIRLSQHHIEKA
ncbi:MAG: type I-C CRISPR-associated protein Cas8c/Csd1, partial [Planctomycetes bacterium]|nr:type I-C CRISPR-associated protein Cas8c/Csd1 [Planctomycetota bacterium]